MLLDNLSIKRGTELENVQVHVIVNVQNININNTISPTTNQHRQKGSPKFSSNVTDKIMSSQTNIFKNLIASKLKKEGKSSVEIKTKEFTFKNNNRKDSMVSAKIRERFRVVFLKLKIVLLFRYILRHIKFVGVKMLNTDIRAEMKNIEALNLARINVSNIIIQEQNSWLDVKISIHPNSTFASLWNFVVIIMLVYTATILPYRTCFYDNSVILSLAWFMESFFDLLFIADLILNFFFGYYTENEILVLKNKSIALNYIKTWFIMDFISTFPFNYLDYFNGMDTTTVSTTYNKLLRLTKIPRLYRLIRLFRVFRFVRIFRHNKFVQYLIKVIKINAGIKRIIVCLCLLIFMSHIFACLFFFVAKMDDLSYETWVSRYNLVSETEGNQYLYAFYFSIVTATTVGFGDIVANTLNEKVLCCFMILFGLAFYTFNIANLALVISKFDNEMSNLETKIHSLNKLSKKIELRDETYLRIKKIFEEDSVNYVTYNEDKFIQEIPNNLRVEVIFHIHEKKITNIKYFMDKSPGFVAELIVKWKKIVFNRKDFVYFEGEVPYDIYFLQKGKAMYVDTEGNDIIRFKNGTILGEIEPFLGVIILFIFL